jgi:hypothetical protein
MRGRVGSRLGLDVDTLVAVAWYDSLGQESTVVITVSRLHPVCFSGLRASAVAPLDLPVLS